VLSQSQPGLTTFTLLRIAQGVFMASAFTLTLAYLGEEYSAADAAAAIRQAPWRGEFDPLEGIILHEPRVGTALVQVETSPPQCELRIEDEVEQRRVVEDVPAAADRDEHGHRVHPMRYADCQRLDLPWPLIGWERHGRHGSLSP
jgi:hypothetical protein